jgi:hypothetical protein
LSEGWIFKYFNQGLAADKLNLVSLSVQNSLSSGLSSWIVPPTPKVHSWDGSLPEEMPMAQLQFWNRDWKAIEDQEKGQKGNQSLH